MYLKTQKHTRTSPPPKRTMFKELKENMTLIQVGRNRPYKNRTEIPELKNTVSEIKHPMGS